MVFVLGCLIVIAIILVISYVLGNQSSGLTTSASPKQQPSTKIPEKYLLVKIKTKNQSDIIIENPPLGLGYLDLKNKFNRIDGGHGYSGPALEQILNLGPPPFGEIIVYDEENKSNKISRQGLSNWIIAIDKNGKPISPDDGGAFLLLNKQDPTKRVLRVARIGTE